jgi:DNA-binding MarR family transcriptional regulator
MPLRRIMRIAEFRAAVRAFERHSEHVARRWDLTPQRYLLLLFVKGAADGSQRVSLTQLTQRLQLGANTVTELVARAEQAGLVQREQAEHDQRVVFISLTREGERRLLGALRESDDLRRELAAAFESLVAGFHSARRR